MNVIKGIDYSLLKESKVPVVEQKENGEGKTQTPAVDNITVEERQLLGRYGVWLLVGRCTPVDKTPDDVLGRLLSMLFYWFHMTAYSYDGNQRIYQTNIMEIFMSFTLGQEESALEKLKTDSVCSWLRDISKSHYKLFISCLLPHPPEYARVGGHW